ncbi:hypothetical protein N8I77_006213 [Diaporthe amygdali]|uniref:Uncharacterized protein n=1 Tax=Phomopsis amygdali TaxID=1214568 RepID=A0AAD9SHB0_PHOAM|nr:hypothetical protein N8I77_006213 [Diaporthe amygdali]
MAQPPKFDLTPEQQASNLEYFRHQLFETCPATTQKDVDLNGKTAILTGANGGIGVECARQLLDLGLNKLILAVREESKGEAALEKISTGRKLSHGQVEIWKLDMSSYESIVNFAERASTLDRLNIVILNAGVYRVNMELNPSTGHEEDVQINYLSTTLLVLLFIGVLKSMRESGSISTAGRIVIVTSDLAAWAKFPERHADPLLPALDKRPAKWDMAERYSTSKLLMQLFLSELIKVVPSSTVVINAANPGFCYGTSLARDADGTILGLLVFIMSRIIGHSSAIGARAVIDAAVNKGQESHGQYVEGGKLRPSAPIIYTAEGEQIAKRLWRETLEELSFAGIEDIVKAFKTT